MKILLTGASGFLGREIFHYLKSLSYDVTTIGRSEINDVKCDLSRNIPFLSKNIDFIIHVAGKAHVVPKNQQEKKDFFDVNLEGTKNLLRGLENKSPKTFVFISTVAVYGIETGEMIDENSPLNGTTPYAKSKILAEAEVLKFGKEHNMKVVVLRPPLIIGKSPEGNLKLLIKAIKKGYYFRIGDGAAKRSIVAAKDIAELVTTLCGKQGVYNVTDRRHPSFKDIDTKISNYYDKKIKVMPKGLMKLAAKLGDVISVFPFNSNKYKKMTNSLTFSDEKAVKELNWIPDNALDNI